MLGRGALDIKHTHRLKQNVTQRALLLFLLLLHLLLLISLFLAAAVGGAVRNYRNAAGVFPAFAPVQCWDTH